jgi:hypothetical protein
MHNIKIICVKLDLQGVQVELYNIAIDWMLLPAKDTTLHHQSKPVVDFVQENSTIPHTNTR